MMKFLHVGVGGFGQVWANTLHQNPEAEVVGMVDISEAALTATCEKFGYGKEICFPDLETAIAKTDADVVVSSTPPARHPVDVITALRAGLHAISEKPMSDTLANC